MLKSADWFGPVLGLAAAIGMAGCGGGGSPESHFQPSRWLSAAPSSRTVTLTLRAGGNGVSLGDFNGYSRGQVLVLLPVRWRVIVRCENVSEAPHSCAIVNGSLAQRPGIPGAATAVVPPGRSATFTVRTTRPGVYRIASLVDDDEVGNAMWDGLQVGGVARPSARLLRPLP